MRKIRNTFFAIYFLYSFPFSTWFKVPQFATKVEHYHWQKKQQPTFKVQQKSWKIGRGLVYLNYFITPDEIPDKSFFSVGCLWKQSCVGQCRLTAKRAMSTWWAFVSFVCLCFHYFSRFVFTAWREEELNAHQTCCICLIVIVVHWSEGKREIDRMKYKFEII